MTSSLNDLRLGMIAIVEGVVCTLDSTDGDALLPDGEAFVTLHVKGLGTPAPARSIGGSTYADVYRQELRSESARPLSVRTRPAHDVAADAVAVHAALDLATDFDDAGLADAASFARTHAEHLTGHSSIAARHNAVVYAANQMSPAYAAWLSRNSQNVYTRLIEVVGEEAAKTLFTEFHISPKEA